MPRIAAWCGVVAAGLLIPGGEPRRGVRRGGAGQGARGVGCSTMAASSRARRSAQLDIDHAADDAARSLCRAAARAAGVRSRRRWRGWSPALLGVMPRRSAGCRAGRAAARCRPRRIDAGRSRRPACAPARCARRATGAISGSPRGTTVLIIDAAPPPVARLVEGGCASTLAFELSDGAAPAHRQLRRRARRPVAQVPADARRGAAHHRGAFDADRSPTAIRPRSMPTARSAAASPKSSWRAQESESVEPDRGEP